MAKSDSTRIANGLLAGGILVILALAVSTTISYAFVLVTPEEAARERARGEPRARGFPRRDSSAPRIVLTSPKSLENILSPLDIEVQFLPKAPSRIVRDSLRVLYGFFELDITDRLIEHAEVTPTGIRAREAALPVGSHSITIEISDDLERVGRRTFLFKVGDK